MVAPLAPMTIMAPVAPLGGVAVLQRIGRGPCKGLAQLDDNIHHRLIIENQGRGLGDFVTTESVQLQSRKNKIRIITNDKEGKYYGEKKKKKKESIYSTI